MTFTKSSKNVGLLVVCQALFMSGQVMIITIVALIGYSLAEVKALATLPLTLQFVAMALTTIPASLMMRHVGRRLGFVVGLVIGMAGSLTGMYAIFSANFWVFCVGSALLGSAGAFGQLYRFAAADAAPIDQRSRAISIVMAGGVFAAFFGPLIANWSRDFMAPVTFAGSYMMVTILQLVSILFIMFLEMPKVELAGAKGSGRPMLEICRQPVFIVAVLSGMLGFAVMNLVMTSTPLAMSGGSHSFADTAFVIQWHALGMFGPSFVTGWVIKRFGILNVIATGAILAGIAAIINLSGGALWQFWLALFLLGIGWNFMFIGGTNLLTTVPSQAEQAKTQAVNDFIIFGMVAISSLSSGAIYAELGWSVVNMLVMPMLAIVVAANLWLRVKETAIRA